MLNGGFSLKMVAFCDIPVRWQMGLQDPATECIETMYEFHNFLISVFCAIGVLVFWVLFYILVMFNENENKKPAVFTHASLLEFVWTIVPAIVLIVIAIPSFELLYSLEEIVEPRYIVKIIGHQWYWTYEYNYLHAAKEIFYKYKYDAYMFSTEDLKEGDFRLLETDRRVLLPVKTHIRLLITSADVIHSWTIPSFGVKMDACPGRLSQVALYIKRKGVFYGQCSEICGVNHGFMPISVKVVSQNQFFAWLKRNYNSSSLYD